MKYTVENSTNTHDHEELREIVAMGNDDIVTARAVRNPNCPQDILLKFFESTDNSCTIFCLQNPNFPPDALEKVLGRGLDDNISRFAAQNPNCPDLAKIKWMIATGRIGKEDPKIHVIEYDNKIDYDLEILKSFISNN